MKKIFTILQMLVGLVVIFFALVLFWQALIAIYPNFKSILDFSLPFRLQGLDKWLQLILSLFILQVVAVYTKELFDSLSVSD